MLTWLPLFGAVAPAHPRESQKAIKVLFRVRVQRFILNQPVFNLESWYTLEMAHIPRHDRILPDKGGCTNEHVFHTNKLAAPCQMGKKCLPRLLPRRR
jgi:hypothetical protein